LQSLRQHAHVSVNPQFSLPRNDYEIGLAEPASGLQMQASALVAALYVARGLALPPAVMCDESPAYTLIAKRDDRVFGTMTLRLDQGGGLLADGLYREQIDGFRRDGARVCEVTGLALDPVYSSSEALASLFNVAFVLARAVYGCSALFAEVHPRHGAFYRRSMGYRLVGPELTCPRVNAPAVLLHLDLAYAEAQIEALAGKPTASARSLYSLFLPPVDNQSLRERLLLLAQAAA